MKRLSRVVALLAIVGLPVVAQAQAAQTASIATTADVATVFSFLTPTAMSFPSVIPGAAAVTASGSIGFQRNTTVKYVIGAITDLKHTDNVSLIPYTATAPTAGTAGFTITSCGLGTTASAIATATTWSSCIANASNAYSTAPSATTTEYIIFNGSLSTTTATKPGLYTGSISITATVN